MFQAGGTKRDSSREEEEPQTGHATGGDSSHDVKTEAEHHDEEEPVAPHTPNEVKSLKVDGELPYLKDPKVSLPAKARMAMEAAVSTFPTGPQGYLLHYFPGQTERAEFAVNLRTTYPVQFDIMYHTGPELPANLNSFYLHLSHLGFDPALSTKPAPYRKTVCQLAESIGLTGFATEMEPLLLAPMQLEGTAVVGAGGEPGRLFWAGNLKAMAREARRGKDCSTIRASQESFKNKQIPRIPGEDCCGV